jgi:hypothetical protein
MWEATAYVAATGGAATLAKKSPHIFLDGNNGFGIAQSRGNGAFAHDERGYPHSLWTSLRTSMCT